MSISASSAQIAAQPIQSGVRALQTPANVTAALATGAGIDIPCDSFSVTLVNTGTLDNAASLKLQAQLNGSSFFDVYVNGSVKSWTGTQINAGVFETINIKANQVRFVLTPGTTTGTNGVIPRILA